MFFRNIFFLFKIGISKNLFLLMIASVLLTSFLSFLASQFSLRQPATVTLDVGLSIARLIIPLVGFFIINDFYFRDFDRKYFMSYFSFPITRKFFVLSRFSVVLLFVLIYLFLMAAALGVVVSLVAVGYAQATPVDLGISYLTVLALMFVEFFVLLAFSLLLSVFGTSVVFVVLGSLGFMLMSRYLLSVIELLNFNSHVVDGGQQYQGWLEYLTYIIPGLGTLDVREMALYGRPDLLPDNIFISVASALTYAILLIAISFLVIEKKKFS